MKRTRLSRKDKMKIIEMYTKHHHYAMSDISGLNEELKQFGIKTNKKEVAKILGFI